jgi:uncharacterized protein DUF1707/2TM domain-containing protein
VSDADLRAADADRERTAERLRNAAAEGRLSAGELEERVGAALEAQTYAELDALVADLPAPAPTPSTPPGHPRRSGRRRELRPFLATSILLVAIWALTGAGYFWPIWPILGWGMFVVGPPGVRGTLPACRRNASSRLSTSR